MVLDTGSVGVRIMAEALDPAIAALLPARTGATDDASGTAPIAQCATFASGHTFGPIRLANVTIGGKSATNLPVQIVGERHFSKPADCLARGGADLGSVGELGGNGIVGIGRRAQDYPEAVAAILPANYYYCPPGTACTGTRMPLAKQVMNPVASFASDNNGTIIRLPALPPGGKESVAGELVFGVGTRQNNMLAADAVILPLDSNGGFTTVYQGRTLTDSAIDSGTDMYRFPDATIPTDAYGNHYTPLNTLNLSATLKPSSGASAGTIVTFSIANSTSLLANNYGAYDSLGGTDSSYFLWGLPFFFGRSVATVLDNTKVGEQSGPFVAF
jgi:hypothetical protein